MKDKKWGKGNQILRCWELGSADKVAQKKKIMLQGLAKCNWPKVFET